MKLLATGREADVFALDDTRVLRRLRRGVTRPWAGDLAHHLRTHDYPAVEVLDVHGADTVFERIDGPTMLDDFGQRPWRLERHAVTLARLHDQLHRIEAPGYLPELGDGDAVVHLDLHPGNVILGPDGPRVIDWTNAAAGRGADDVALTWVIVSTAAIPVAGPRRVLLGAGRRLFLSRFLAAAGRSDARAALGFGSALRLCDAGLPDDERVAVERLRRRFTSGSADATV